MSRRTALLVAITSLAFATATAAVADRRASVLSSQPFAAGALPGSPGIVIKTKGSNAHCGGVALTATIKKAKKPDKLLAAVFALKFPTGLDFDPNHTAKVKKSQERFEAWYSSISDAGQKAGEHYRTVMADANAAAVDRVAAAARMAQVARWTAHTIARAEVPKNLRTSEFSADAVQVFCDALADKAEPLEVMAIDAASHCRDLASRLNAGAGWWDDACAP